MVVGSAGTRTVAFTSAVPAGDSEVDFGAVYPKIEISPWSEGYNPAKERTYERGYFNPFILGEFRSSGYC
jgi:hypothetical protein